MATDARLTIGAGEAPAAWRDSREPAGKWRPVGKPSNTGSVETIEGDFEEFVSDDKQLVETYKPSSDVRLIEMVHKRKRGDLSRGIEHGCGGIEGGSSGRARAFATPSYREAENR